MKGFQQGSDVLRFLLSEHQAGSVVLDTLEGVGGGVREAGEVRVAVVKARQNERDNKFGGCFSVKVFPDQGDAAEVEEAGAGSSGDNVGHGEGGVEDDPEVLGRIRERYGCVVKVKMERGKEL